MGSQKKVSGELLGKRAENTFPTTDYLRGYSEAKAIESKKFNESLDKIENQVKEIIYALREENKQLKLKIASMTTSFDKTKWTW